MHPPGVSIESMYMYMYIPRHSRKGRAPGNLVQIRCLPRHFAATLTPKLYFKLYLPSLPHYWRVSQETLLPDIIYGGSREKKRAREEPYAGILVEPIQRRWRSTCDACDRFWRHIDAIWNSVQLTAMTKCVYIKQVGNDTGRNCDKINVASSSRNALLAQICESKFRRSSLSTLIDFTLRYFCFFNLCILYGILYNRCFII